MPAITFTALIHKHLAEMHEKIMKSCPDKTNLGRALASTLVWDCVQSYAKKQSDVAWKQMEKEDIYDDTGLPPGQHQLADSPRFTIDASVSKPYQVFAPNVLAEVLNRKYKVPKPIAIEMINHAKVEGKSRVTLSITER